MSSLEHDFEQYLIKYQDGSLSEQETEEMRKLMIEHEHLRKIFVQGQVLDAILYKNKLSHSDTAPIISSEAKTKRIEFIKVALLAAASIILGFGLFLFYNEKHRNDSLIIATLTDDSLKKSTVSIVRNKENILQSLPAIIQSNDIITSLDRELDIKFSNDSSIIILRENSTIKIQESNGAKILTLIHGDIFCDIDKQKTPMIIYSQGAKTTVLGTQFHLSSDQHKSEISVSEGLVKFENTLSKKQVEAKAGWQARIISQDIKVFPAQVEDKQIVVKKLILIDPDRKISISGHDPFLHDTILKLSEIESEHLNILMDADEKYVGGVFFKLRGVDPKGKPIDIRSERGQKRQIVRESIYPYFVLGDGKGPTKEIPSRWIPQFGEYTLKYTPYGKGKNKKRLGKQITFKFSIIP